MKPVSLARLQELLDAYGADPARWPGAERAAAERLVAQSAAARQLLEQAQPLDVALDLWQPAPPAGALAERILQSLPAASPGWRAQLAQIWAELGGWQLAAPAFAASLMLGAIMPLWLESADGDLPDEDLIAAVQFIDEPPE